MSFIGVRLSTKARFFVLSSCGIYFLGYNTTQYSIIVVII